MTDPSGPLGLPDTPGPEATPEQEAFVRGLLGSLAADDPAIPDHVAARLDGVLAEERRRGAAPAAGALAAARAGEDGDDAVTGPATGSATGTADGAATGTVTVLPVPERRGPGLRGFRLVAGIAAAAVVVVGGAALVVRGGSSTSSDTASLAGGASAPAVALQSTGTRYVAAELATQARALVTAARQYSGADQGEEGPVTATDDGQAPEVGAASSPPTTDAAAAGLLTRTTVADCLEQLTGHPGTEPVAIDQATYDGSPADVIVVPSDDDPGALDVWVVGPGCTRQEADMLAFQRIPAP